MFALDHPAPPLGVGGVHIGAHIPTAADADRVAAAVTAHQVSHRVLEAGVVQGVQLGQSVPQALRTDRFPPRPLLSLVEPAAAGQHREHADGGQDPPVSLQPVDDGHHQGRRSGPRLRGSRSAGRLRAVAACAASGYLAAPAGASASPSLSGHAGSSAGLRDAARKLTQDVQDSLADRGGSEQDPQRQNDDDGHILVEAAAGLRTLAQPRQPGPRRCRAADMRSVRARPTRRDPRAGGQK